MPSSIHREADAISSPWRLATENHDLAVVDLIKAWKPPFDPSEVVKQCADAIKPYRIKTITGDNYGGEWPVAEFRKQSITYQLSEKHRSELYLNLIPVVNSRRCELPDDRRMIDELRRLERRRGRSGKDSVDHPQYGGSDDIANAVAGVIDLVISKPQPSKYAVPVGVGRGIGADLRRSFGAVLAMDKPLNGGLPLDEQSPGKGGAWRYRFCWGDNGDE